MNRTHRSRLASMLLATPIALSQSAAFAYQVEAGGSFGMNTRDGTVYNYTIYDGFFETYTVVESESVDDTDFTFDVHGTYYLSNVNNQGGPRKYDPFLAKASSVSGSLYYDGSGNVLSFGGRYVLEQLDQVDGVFIGGNLTSASNDSYSRDSFTITGGKYLTDTSTFTVDLYSADSSDFGDDGRDIVLGLHYLTLLTLNEEQFLGVSGGLGFGDYTYFYGNGEFFLSKDISFGAGIGINDDDDYEHFQLSLFGTFFIEPNIKTSAGFLYRDVEAWFGDYDRIIFEVGVDLRF